MKDEDAARMWEYRKENFKAILETEDPKNYTCNEESFNICITGNGFQWSVIQVIGETELQAVADLVNEKLEELKKRK